MNGFLFHLEKKRGQARAGSFITPHGKVETPIYMPVGTQATVKALDSEDLLAAHTPIILANTYHLYLRPGTERLQRLGGLHKFMNWDKPILTDSGGFQVFSLGKQMESKGLVRNDTGRGIPTTDDEARVPNVQTLAMTKVQDDGVAFTSYVDGTKHFFSPEKAIEIQREIGADIIMAFDECTPDQAELSYVKEALDRTHRWAAQCKAYWEKQERKSVYGKYQALFGIIQGAQNKEFRRLSAQTIVDLDFDGVAVGGETIGYNMPVTVEIADWLKDILPEDKPRYAMGLGRDPQNLIDAVEAGFDMFDCVAPTRLARNGAVYHGELSSENGRFVFNSQYKNGRLQIGNAKYSADDGVIQEGCDCTTCVAGYSRAYLNHLYRTQELAYYRLASIHNVRFMIRLTEQMRTEILR